MADHWFVPGQPAMADAHLAPAMADVACACSFCRGAARRESVVFPAWAAETDPTTTKEVKDTNDATKRVFTPEEFKAWLEKYCIKDDETEGERPRDPDEGAEPRCDGSLRVCASCLELVCGVCNPSHHCEKAADRAEASQPKPTRCRHDDDWAWNTGSLCDWCRSTICERCLRVCMGCTSRFCSVCLISHRCETAAAPPQEPVTS